MNHSTNLRVGFYTPTPAFRAIPEHVAVMRESGELVALCGPAHPVSEATQADARLFASASDLAEALQGMVAYFEAAGVSVDCVDEDHPLPAARRALAKAGVE